METFLTDLLAKLGEFCATTGIRILGAILVLLIGVIVVKAILNRIKKGKKFANMAPNTQTLVIDISMVVMYALVIAITACTLGVSETAIASVITSCGLVVGLALQGSLSNFAGGIMILLFNPFSIGDFIEANGVSGTVKNIGIFYTTLTTPDNKVVTMPNGALANAVVIDYSTNDTRRVDLEISVSYDSDIELVKKTLLDLADAHELVLKDPAPFVRLSAHADSALVFKFRVWVKSSDYWTVNFDLLEASKKIFDIRGINIPYPQMDVHINNIEK